ncbi:MAG: ligase, partial [Chitinophagaceae bacterium]|nr:ligase [Chitinophagaceae bacterium]
MSLAKYREKRKFNETPEPTGGKPAAKKLTFVIQKHAASHLHYDFRLEMEGVLKSWAVPKGPSMDPSVKRLAMMVEDHPYDYKNFEGIIPKGNYGAGTVIVWDEGWYEPAEKISGSLKEIEKSLLSQLHKGTLKIKMHGKKLKGEFALVRASQRGDNSWLLMKLNDDYAGETDITKKDKSVQSGKTLEQVKSTSNKKWISNKDSSGKLKDKDEETGQEESEELNEILNAAPKTAFPSAIKPMQVKESKEIFDGDDWFFEIDWLSEGERVMAFINHDKVQLKSGAKPVTKQFSAITESLKDINHKCILDGAIVCLNEEGLPVSAGDPKNQSVFFVFDILWLDGKDLMGLSLTVRKSLLEEILTASDVIKYVDHIEQNGIAFYEVALKKGLHAIIAREKNSIYTPGKKNDDWLSIKMNSKVKIQKEKKSTIKKGRRIKGSMFEPGKKEETISIKSHPIKFTNLDKIFWPDLKLTKRDVLNYYNDMMPYILPYMKNRPQSLNRHPDGINGENFFQKNVKGKVPEWITTHPYTSESDGQTKDFFVCTDEASLMYIVNLGCIELNPWHSRIEHAENPDWCVIDLDPNNIDFKKVIETANAVKDLLDEIKVPSYCKTSGSRGLHIYIPLGAKYTYDQSRQFAELLVNVVFPKVS